MKSVIFDTGPIVAWLCPRDQHHEWSRRAFSSIRAPGIICEAVITEACHLVAREGIAACKVAEFVIDGGFQVISLAADIPRIRKLLETYADTPMDFADACITRMAELHHGATVCTTDSDFVIYRKHQTEPISLLAPFSD